MYRVRVGRFSRNTARIGSSYADALAIYESKRDDGSLFSYFLGGIGRVCSAKYT